VISTVLAAALLLQVAPYRTGPGAPATATYGTPGAPAYRLGPGAGEGGAGEAPATTPPVNLALTGVTIDAYDRSVERRWAPDDPFYTGTVRGGAALAQGRQGPLDGGWTVTGSDGAPLYVLQLVDAGQGWLEGAWRKGDATAANRPSSSGFIALINRESGRVVLRFLEPGASTPTVLTLEMTAEGWRGQAERSGDAVLPIRMVRR
jgi:hypothetical protein